MRSKFVQYYVEGEDEDVYEVNVAAPANPVATENTVEVTLAAANQITLKLGHDYIGTEHILYGLAKETKGVASKVLEGQTITADNILNQIEDPNNILYGQRLLLP